MQDRSQPSNIENRPSALSEIPLYNQLPEKTLRLEVAGGLNDFIIHDILELDGIQPLETTHLDDENRIFVNPSKHSADIYRKKKTRFQMISVVINAYGFEDKGDYISAKPYNISLFPASKRGVTTSQSIEFVEKLDLESLNQEPHLYAGFNPFKGAYGLYITGRGPEVNIESDMLGFVYSTFYLATTFDHCNVMVPEIPHFQDNNKVRKEYAKYRRHWYFKPFSKLKPRKIWGCDSPIELFLLQALDHIGLAPEIQTIICEDGYTVPNFHNLWQNQKSRKKLKQITDADFFFPDQKLAVFCDSKEHHGKPHQIEKDFNIDAKLKRIGIDSIRLSGSDIVKNPIECAERIKKRLIN